MYIYAGLMECISQKVATYSIWTVCPCFFFEQLYRLNFQSEAFIANLANKTDLTHLLIAHPG